MTLLHISEDGLAAIRRHGAEEFPHECCGVMIGDVEGDSRTVRELRRLPNVHEEQHERRYLISPDEMFRLLQEERRTGLKVLGFYHSHPNHPARPSEYDRDWASPWYIYIIVSVQDGTPQDLTGWQLNAELSAFDPVPVGG